LAYPLHTTMDSYVLYLLRSAVLTPSTVVAAIVQPRCSTPYSTAMSTTSFTLALIFPKVP
jgi:hypothetical protein